MCNIELLPERQVERVEHQTVSKWIDEQRGSTRQSYREQFAPLRGRPFFGPQLAPFPLDESCSDENAECDHTQRPRSMGVDPQAEERRN